MIKKDHVGFWVLSQRPDVLPILTAEGEDRRNVYTINNNVKIFCFLLIFFLNTCSDRSNIVKNLKSRKLRWQGYLAGMGEDRTIVRVVTSKPWGKKSVGGPRYRSGDNVIARKFAKICSDVRG